MTLLVPFALVILVALLLRLQEVWVPWRFLWPGAEPGPAVLVLTMASRSYVPGVIGLARSIWASSGAEGYNITVILADDVPDAERELLRGLGITVAVCLYETLERELEIPPVSRLGRTRHTCKLDIWLNPDFRAFDRILYLDADSLVVGDLKGLVGYRFREPASTLAAFRTPNAWFWNGFSRRCSGEICRVHDCARPYGQSNLFLVDMQRFAQRNTPEEAFRRINETAHRFPGCARWWEQEFLFLFLYEEYELFTDPPPILHFHNWNLPWLPEGKRKGKLNGTDLALFERYYKNATTASVPR